MLSNPNRLARELLLVLLVVFGLWTFLFVPAASLVARAQEITATTEATPPAAIIVPESDTPVVIPGTATTPTIVIEPSARFNPVVLVVGAVALLLIGFGIAVLHGKNPDKAAVEQIDVFRLNANVISEVRAGYEHSTETIKQAMTALTTVVTAIAPFTPFKTDDELSLLLHDITDPVLRAQVAATVKASLAPPADKSAAWLNNPPESG